MRRLIFILAALTVSAGLCAQTNDWGWPDTHSRSEINIDKENNNVTIDRNMYVWRPFDDVVGYSIYGSRYRKAVSNKSWGITLCIVAPVLGIATAGALDSGGVRTWVIVTGGVLVCGGALGAGIPLWVKGQKELDAMLDDYVKNYGPKPHAANLTAGLTRSGIGLALNF